jgi:hypothetical protein
MNTIPLRYLQRTGDFVMIWANTIACKMVVYDRNLEAVRIALEEGRVTEAHEIAVETIEHRDAERPEIHMLLGICAIRTGDDAKIEQVFQNLGMFEHSWTDKFREFVEKHRRP